MGRKSDSVREQKGPKRRRIRVLRVDDHPSVLAGVRAYLSLRRDFTIVGQALDGEDALMKSKRLKADVLILDLSLPR